MRLRRRRGQGLIDALVALLVAGLVLAGAAAIFGRIAQRWRAPAAARAAASDVRRQRSQAVATAAHHGLRFARDARGRWSVSMLRDGDADGIRTDDLRRGIDVVVSGPHDVQARWGLQPGFATRLTTLRSPPPDDDPLGRLEDPVRFGTRDIVSASPRGTITPGTLYLSDGAQRQFAVVVAGSARVRCWEYLLERREWVLR